MNNLRHEMSGKNCLIYRTMQKKLNQINYVDYINKVIGASEELQKGLTDYSKNIEYLKSLKNSVPEGSTLSSSIDDLIQQ